MSSKPHVCLLQTIGAEVIEPVFGRHWFHIIFLTGTTDRRSRRQDLYKWFFLIISPRWGVRFTYNNSSRLAPHLVILRGNDWA